MASDISAQIGVDGERQFRDSVKAIDNEIKALNAEMKQAVAEFDSMDNAETNAAKKSQILTDQIDKQKDKLAVLQNQYARQTSELDRLAAELEKAKKEFGENSEEAGKAQNAYNKQSVEVSKLRTQIADTNTKIAEANKELKDMEGAGKNAANGLEEARSKASTFGETMKGVLSAELIKAGVTAVVNGLKDAANAFKDGINAAAEYGDQIDKQSQKLQISAEDYQKLAFAAERSGTSIDVMATAQKSLANSDFNGSLMDAIQAVAGVADESERAALATELFGKKAGMEMLPLLNSGAEGINELYQQFESLGGVMSNEAVAAAAAYEDAMTNLQTALNGVKNQMVGEFLPGVTTVMEGIVDIIQGKTEEGKQKIDNGFKDIEKQIQDFTKNVAERAPELLEIGIKLLSALIMGIVSSLPTLAAQAPEIIKVLVDGILSLLYQIAQVGVQIMQTLAHELTSGLSEIKNIGRNIVSGLWDGIKERSTWLLNQVRGWCQSILNEITEFFDINSPSRVMRDEVGVMLARGMAVGIDKGADYALDSMQQLGRDMLSVTPGITSQMDIQANANGTLAEGLINGMASMRNTEPINLSVKLVLDNTREIAEAVFNDLLDVSKQRGVSLAEY